MDNNNLGLVAHVQKALDEKWGYVWGTFGQVLTVALLAVKATQYPASVGQHKDFILKTWLNRKTVDCVGLIKSYMWRYEKGVAYDVVTDITADAMYSKATRKGNILTAPETIGLCLWKKGHVGVYIGNDWVIEAHGTKVGVIKTPLMGKGSTAWTHWFECPFITYLKPTTVATATPIEQDVAYKFEGLEKLNKYKLLNDLPQWASKAEDPAPVWFVAELVRRVYEKLKGE